MERPDPVVAPFDNLALGDRVAVRGAQSRKHKEPRLRFVFSDRVLSFGIAADATFGEVASALRELVPEHYGRPVSIDCIQSIGSSPN